MDDYLGAVFVFALAVLLAIVTVVMMVFFVVYRRTRVVKLANLWFIELTLVGALMVLASIILWSVYQTKTICTIKSCLGMLGFGIVFGYPHLIPSSSSDTCVGACWQRPFATFSSTSTTDTQPRK